MPITRTIEMAACEGCCEDVPNCPTVQCRTRDGPEATICGHPEFADASTPPKKYRTISVTGKWRDCTYDVSDCSENPEDQDVQIYSGSCEYSAEDCSTNNTLMTTYGRHIGSSPCAEPSTTPNDYPICNRAYSPSIYDYVAVATVTATQTQLEWDYSTATPCGKISDVFYRTWFDAINWELTNVATIFEAIARETPSAWSAYGTCSTSGVTFVSQRGSGDFTSTWREGQLRASCENLVAGESYKLTISTQKRLTGSSDAWATGPSIENTFVAAGTTDTISDIDLPLIDQYEVRVSGVGIELL